MIFCRNKVFYPSADRNKSFILDVLKQHFDADKQGTVLEISSGTGQHISYFAQHFPLLTFQPTEYEKSLFKSIEAYALDTPTKNVKLAIHVDVTTDFETWNTDKQLYDYLINVNMIHIAPYQCSIMLFQNAGKLLKNKGLMITYGPYAVDGVLTPQSNVDFDRNLRTQDSEWGVRDVKDLENLAKQNNMKLLKVYDLPANNKCLVWINENANY